MTDETELWFEPSDPVLGLYLSDQPYFVERSREDGELDLMELARSDFHEEGSWAYSADQGVWFNMRKSSKADLDVQTDGLYSSALVLALDLSQFGEEVDHYHTHPKPFLEAQAQQLMSFPVNKELADKAIAEGRQEDLDKLLSNVMEYVHFYAAMPSVGDLTAFASYQSLSPDADINFKIVSPAGLTTVQVNPERVTAQILEDFKSIRDESYMSKVKIDDQIDPVEVINEAMDGAISIAFESR